MLLHPASRLVLFKVEIKRWCQVTLQVLPSWLQSPCHSRSRTAGITLSLHLAGLVPGLAPEQPGGRRVGVPTCPVTAQHLQAHSYSRWGPPLWVHSDVLGRNRVKPPDFRDVVVDVAFKKLHREKEREKRQEMCAFHMLSTRLDILGLAECSHTLK